jgi:hypothetical protein
MNPRVDKVSVLTTSKYQYPFVRTSFDTDTFHIAIHTIVTETTLFPEMSVLVVDWLFAKFTTEKHTMGMDDY